MSTSEHNILKDWLTLFEPEKLWSSVSWCEHIILKWEKNSFYFRTKHRNPIWCYTHSFQWKYIVTNTYRAGQVGANLSGCNFQLRSDLKLLIRIVIIMLPHEADGRFIFFGVFKSNQSFLLIGHTNNDRLKKSNNTFLFIFLNSTTTN